MNESGGSMSRIRSLADALSPRHEDIAPLAQSGPSEREKAFELARREGYAAGLSEAEAEVARRVAEVAANLEEKVRAEHARLNDAMETVSRLGRGIEAALVDYARLAEEVAVEAAYAAILRLLEVRDTDRALVSEFCRQALASFGSGAKTVRLAPGDVVDRLAGEFGVTVVEDPSLAPGQCVIESLRGASDTGLDVRLEAMRLAFLEGLAEHRRRG